MISTVSDTPRPVILWYVKTFYLLKFCYGELGLNQDKGSWWPYVGWQLCKSCHWLHFLSLIIYTIRACGEDAPSEVVRKRRRERVFALGRVHERHAVVFTVVVWPATPTWKLKPYLLINAPPDLSLHYFDTYIEFQYFVVRRCQTTEFATRSLHSHVMLILTHPSVCMKYSICNILLCAHCLYMRPLNFSDLVWFPA